MRLPQARTRGQEYICRHAYAWPSADTGEWDGEERPDNKPARTDGAPGLKSHRLEHASGWPGSWVRASVPHVAGQNGHKMVNSGRGH